MSEEDQNTANNEEISIDFSKIKNIFKKKEHNHTKSVSDDEDQDISFDFKRVIPIFQKYGIILLILIPLFLSVFFRMYPANLPMAEDWSRNNVENYYKNNIAQQVNAQFPNLPQSNKDNLINSNFESYLEQNEAMIDQQVAENANTIKEHFKDEDGNTYLLAIDPYTFYRTTRNIVEDGHHYDELKDGTPWNNHMLAPIGRPMGKNPHFHVIVQYWIYKILKIFNSNISLMGAIFYVPIIISMLSVIPAFFITRKFAGNVGGFVAALMVAIHPAFLSRTPGGFADTDAYNVFFPLFILWIFLEAIETDDLKKKLGLGALAGFTLGIYSGFWIPWIIFDIMIATLLIYIGYTFLFKKKDMGGIKKAVLLLIVLVISTQIFSLAFSGNNVVKSGVVDPFNVIFRLKASAHANYWPNVYTTVAELNEASLTKIVSDIGFGGKTGGRLFFLFSIIGIGLTLFGKNKKFDIKFAALLLLWFAGTMFGSTKGIRFVLLLVPAFSIAVGVFFGYTYNFVTKYLTKSLEVHKYISQGIVILLIVVLFIGPMRSADAIANNEVPSMTDAWYNSLTKIKEESQPDAIINSWWDFGHWFKAIGDRAVTFDGASQNTPMAHWIGKSLLTDDEQLSIGILRMLDCGSNFAFEYVNENVTNGDIDESVSLLYDMISVDKEDAKLILESRYSVTDSASEKILSLTHCIPPENYYITSEDMVGKSGVWAHFGSWDFEKSQMWINVKGKTLTEGIDYLKSNFNVTDSEAETLYYQIQNLDAGRSSNDWIAPWPSYMSGRSGCSAVGEELYSCGNGLLVNITSMVGSINTQQGVKNTKSLAYVNIDGEFVVKEFTGEDIIDVSAAIIPSGDGFSSILLDPALAGSMFTRLFYYEGHGLEHFDKFSDQQSLMGGRIIVWDVDWNGTDANEAFIFEEVTTSTSTTTSSTASTTTIDANQATNET